MPKFLWRKRPFACLLFSACLILSAIALPAFAHDDPAADPTLHITVYNRNRAAMIGNLNDIEEQILHTPGAVTALPAEKYTDKYVLNMHDALASAPGVYAQTRYGEEVRLSIRGSGLSRGFHLRGINMLIDGAPVNLADGGGDFYEIDPLSAQHIEIYRGANALRYGSATLGGAINAVSLSGKSAGFDNMARFEMGSFESFRTQGAIARVGDNWDLYGSAMLSSVGGWRTHSEQENAKLRANLGLNIGENAETRFYVSYNNINQNVPGTLSRSDALNRPQNAAPINVLNDYARDIRSVRLSNKTMWKPDHGTTIETGGYVNFKNLFHPINTVIDQESVDLGAFGRIQANRELGGQLHRFLLGMNVATGNIDANQYTNVRGSRGVKTYDADQDADNVELYGEAELRLQSDFAFVLGGQALHAQREVDNYLSPAASASKDYTEFNPKIGVLYDISPSILAFANISRSSEIPTFSELVQQPVVGFVPLKPQTAWTAEIGSRGTYDSVTWDAALYHSRIDGEMLQFVTGPDIPAATFNAGDTIHQGLELGVNWTMKRNWFELGDSLTLSQIYNWNDFKFDGDPVYGDNRLAGIPQHVLRTELKYATDTWSIAPNIEWVPQAAYVDFANTLKGTDYAIVNIEAKTDLTENAEAFLELRNLFDRNYISNFSTITDASVAGTSVFYPGEPLSVYLGVKLRF